MIFLPDETWRNVFSHFGCVLHDCYWMCLDSDGCYDYDVIDNQTRRKTLTSLSIVCRQFSRVVHDLLYRTVLLHRGGRLKCWATFFLRTLATQPQFGLKVREISLCKEFALPTHAEYNSLQEALVSLEMPLVFKQSLRAERSLGFGQCQGPALHSAILCLTPHVRKIDCKFDPDAEKSLPWILGGTLDESQEIDCSAAPSHANQLPDLEELGLTALAEHEEAWSMQKFEAIFFHPKIKILRLEAFNWTQEVAEIMQWSSFTCNLRRLHMHDCFVDGSTMRNILIHFKSLQSLSIELRSYDPEELDHYLSLDEFGDALRELGHNLVEFDLRTEQFAIKWGLPGEIGPLHSLKSLQHLTMSSEDLLSSENHPDGRIRLADTLPPSLETLKVLASCFVEGELDLLDDAQGQIYELITGGLVPNLRKITLWKYACPTDPKFEWDIEGWDIDEEDAWRLKDIDQDYEVRTWVRISRPS